MPRAARLKERDLARIHRKGRSVSHGPFRCVWLENRVGRTRATVVVGRKVSGKAVTRNRIKRQVRAALEALMPRLPALDLVIHVRGSILAEPRYDTILAELTTGLHRARLLGA